MQTKPGALYVLCIPATMESFKQMLQVFTTDPDALVFNTEIQTSV